MLIIKKALQAIYSLYVLLIFMVCTLMAFPFAMACLGFGKIKGGNYIYEICKIWVRIWYFFIGIRHESIFEAPYHSNRQYIFVANHISYMDIPPAVLAVQQACRVLGKAEMVKYPVFGWIYKAAVILVDRSSHEARAKSVRALKAALSKDISIFIFPEGTFNETEQPLKKFYDGAFKLAIETKTPIKPMLFIDTIDRLHYKSLFSATPGKSRVVYLETIEVTHYNPEDVELLKSKTYDLMDTYLRKYRHYN